MAYIKTRPSKAVYQHLSTGQRSEIRRTLLTKVNRPEEFTAEAKRQASEPSAWSRGGRLGSRA